MKQMKFFLIFAITVSIWANSFVHSFNGQIVTGTLETPFELLTQKILIQ